MGGHATEFFLKDDFVGNVLLFFVFVRKPRRSAPMLRVFSSSIFRGKLFLSRTHPMDSSFVPSCCSRLTQCFDPFAAGFRVAHERRCKARAQRV